MGNLSLMGEFVGVVDGSGEIVRCTTSPTGLLVKLAKNSRYDLPNGSTIEVTVFPGVANKEKTFTAMITDEAYADGARFLGTADILAPHDSKIVPISFKYTKNEMGPGMYVDKLPYGHNDWGYEEAHHGFIHHELPGAGTGDMPPPMGFFIDDVVGSAYVLCCIGNPKGGRIALYPELRDKMDDSGTFELVTEPFIAKRERVWTIPISDELFSEKGVPITVNNDMMQRFYGTMAPVAFRYIPLITGLYAERVPGTGRYDTGYIGRDTAMDYGINSYGEFVNYDDRTTISIINRFYSNNQGWLLALDPVRRDDFPNGTEVNIVLWKDTQREVKLQVNIEEGHWGEGVFYNNNGWLLNDDENKVVPFDLSFTVVNNRPGIDIDSVVGTYSAGDVRWSGWVTQEYVDNLTQRYGSEWNRVPVLGMCDVGLPIAEYVSAHFSYVSATGKCGTVVALRESARAAYPVGTRFNLAVFENTGTDWEHWAGIIVNDDTFVTGTVSDSGEDYFGDMMTNAGIRRISELMSYTTDVSVVFPPDRGTLHLDDYFDPHNDVYCRGRVIEADIARRIPILGHHADPFSAGDHLEKIGYIYTYGGDTFFALKSGLQGTIPDETTLSLTVTGNDGLIHYRTLGCAPSLFTDGVVFKGLEVYKFRRSTWLRMFPLTSFINYGVIVGTPDDVEYGWRTVNGVTYGGLVGTNADHFKTQLIGLWTENRQLVAQLPPDKKTMAAIRVDLYENVNGETAESHFLMNTGDGVCRTNDPVGRPGDRFATWVGRTVPFWPTALSRVS